MGYEIADCNHQSDKKRRKEDFEASIDKHDAEMCHTIVHLGQEKFPYTIEILYKIWSFSKNSPFKPFYKKPIKENESKAPQPKRRTGWFSFPIFLA